MRNPVRKIALFALIQVMFLAACGGGSNDLAAGSSGSTASTGANVTQITVDGGPTAAAGDFNIPFISVTLCAPGSTTNCQTIDHVEVDTGSYGLRIISSAISPSLLAALPMETTPTLNVPIVECTIFGDGFTWGSMRKADLQIASEKASSIPMQVIGDADFPNIPTDCSNTGASEDTVADFGANGILGVGPFVQDCGDTCANGTTEPIIYYACATGGGTCNATQVPLAEQASNPVASFTTDNNGVIVELPAIADGGSGTITGSLVFGIGTESNNGLGSATVLTTDNVYGYITTTYKNTQYTESFLDSGSNLIFLNDSTITTCTIGSSTSSTVGNNTFFCPTSELTLTAVNQGQNGTQSSVTFKIGDAQTELGNNSFVAFENLGAPAFAGQNLTFDFGLPFFYGRHVFTAIDGMNTSGGTGPYFAY